MSDEIELPVWTGTRDNRALRVGSMIHWALTGPAWRIAEQLAQIVETNPDLVIEGQCMVVGGPPLTEEERRAQFNARAEGAWRDDE